MSIFPTIQNEPIIAVNDRTRIDASKTYTTPDESIYEILIYPDATASGVYFDVTTDKYLDWQYSASGSVTAVCVAKTSATGAASTASGTFSVLTEAQDYLFSNDQTLKVHEPDVLKWVQDGRNSFKDVHRRAQTIIVDWLDQHGYTDIDGNKYTKAAIVHIEEVASWATFLALRLIFEGISNAVDDVFSDKAKKYKGLEVEARNRAVLRLDVDGDGVADPIAEVTYINGAVVVRR